MNGDTRPKGIRLSLLVKLSGTICVLLLSALLIQAVINIFSLQTMSFDTAIIMGRDKLAGYITIFEDRIAQEYGRISFRNGDLTDEYGKSLKNDYKVVDWIASRLGVHATIFMRDNQDYRRISTSIIDASGKRAVDTFLGTGSSAYNSIQAGTDYSGNAVILGNNYLTVYRPLFASASREIIGILFIGTEISAIEQHIANTANSKILSTFLLSLAILFVIGAVTFLFARSIVKPIQKVNLTLKDISEGEGDLTKRIESHSNDEVGDLAIYFNLTLEKIKHLVKSIKNETDKLSEVGHQMADNMEETATATNEITANIQSMKTRVHNQSEYVSETHVTMDEVTGNINLLDKHVEKQNNYVTQASASIEEMVANVRSVTDTLVKNSANVKMLKESSEAGRTGLQDMATDIQEIARESEGIMEIISVMENIASQTNLLSMNAAIEAAHAGEAGKGFAVVADEIRKLAESSGEQSKTISMVVKKIKGSIDKISDSNQNVLNKFESIDSSVKIVTEQEESIRYAMEEQDQGSQQMLKVIADVNEITRDVKNDSGEMLKEAQDVIKETKNLDKASQELNEGMNEMTLGVEQINIAVNHITEISAKNREGVVTLAREVSRFKVD